MAISEILKESLTITFFVFIMMMFVDYLNVLSKGKMSQLIKGGLFRQYLITSFLGATPGCLGTFMSVSFYLRGLITFGAITGCMVSSSGDAAFVMLSMFPKEAILLFFILFILGILSAYITDKLVPFFKIVPCKECGLSIHLEDQRRYIGFKEIQENFRKISFSRFLLLLVFLGSFYSFIFLVKEGWNWERITFVFLILIACFIVVTVPEHYLEEHIWSHIIKKHLWKTFLWIFLAFFIVDSGMKLWNLENVLKTHTILVLLSAGLIGIIPDSAPHLIFVFMFAKGLIPFSVLLTSSIVQDGHGMLPLLSYSIKDSILVKLFNLAIGLAVGFIVYLLGL